MTIDNSLRTQMLRSTSRSPVDSQHAVVPVEPRASVPRRDAKAFGWSNLPATKNGIDFPLVGTLTVSVSENAPVVPLRNPTAPRLEADVAKSLMLTVGVFRRSDWTHGDPNTARAPTRRIAPRGSRCCCSAIRPALPVRPAADDRNAISAAAICTFDSHTTKPRDWEELKLETRAPVDTVDMKNSGANGRSPSFAAQSPLPQSSWRAESGTRGRASEWAAPGDRAQG